MAKFKSFINELSPLSTDFNPFDNSFARALGINPDGTLMKFKRKTHKCPKCGENSAYYKEEHPDTDMNCMVEKCPCGYEKEM